MNKEKKVLILGANGYLGYFLIKYAPNNYEIITSSRNKNVLSKFSFIQLDITKKDELINTFEKIKPNIIINSAAVSLPDYAEQHKEETYRINVEGVENIIEGCLKINAKLIHISTDYIFSNKGNYNENDEYSPVNYYGYTKVEAEKLIRNSKLLYLILRPSFLYGIKENYHRPNNFYNIYNKLIENKKVQLTGQIGSPTLVDDLAITIYKLLDFKKSEIYHTAGESMSRYEFGLKIAEVFNLDKNLIEYVEHLPSIAPRPRNSSLNCSKLEQDYKIKFRDVKSSLEFIKSQINLKYL